MDERRGHRAVHAHGLAAFHLVQPGAREQRPIDAFPSLGPQRADRLVQDRLLRAPSPWQPGKGPERGGVLEMEGQLLVAELAMLLEQRTAQHRLGRQAFAAGFLDAVPAQILRHLPQKLPMLVEPLRHGFQLTADLVSGEQIEYAGLDGAFLAHCRLRWLRVSL